MSNTGRRKRVGLALGGGVARGMAHVGVLSILEEKGIPIDYVAGTSAGSLIGAFYCAGRSLDQIMKLGMRVRWWNLASLVWPALGFFSFEKMERWLVQELGDLTFADLETPFAAVAADLNTGEPIRLSQGRLAPAVRASCSVPGFTTPVQIDGRLLGDGSLADTVPVDILRQMGAEYVIGVDIFAASIRPRWGPFGMGFNALEILVRRSGGGIEKADCLITPELAGATYVRFSQRQRLFDVGVKAAREKISCIREAVFQSCTG